MSPEQRDKVARTVAARIARARELLAYADSVGIEIGWENGYTTFHPADATPQRFIEEATILSAEIRMLRERRGH